MATERCKRCGKPISLIERKRGVVVVVDPERVFIERPTETVINGNGETVTGVIGEMGYKLHKPNCDKRQAKHKG